MRFAENGGETKVTNLDLTLVAINEDVVTFEVSMDDWWVMTMKVKQTLQDLPTPMLHCPNVHPSVFLPIPVNRKTEAKQSEERMNESPTKIDIKKHLLFECARGEHLSNKVDVPVGDVHPRDVELHDVLVLEGFEQVDLTIQPLKVIWALEEVIELHLVPSHLNPLILIKSPITTHTNPTTQKSIEKYKKNMIKGKFVEVINHTQFLKLLCQGSHCTAYKQEKYL